MNTPRLHVGAFSSSPMRRGGATGSYRPLAAFRRPRLGDGPPAVAVMDGLIVYFRFWRHCDHSIARGHSNPIPASSAQVGRSHRVLSALPIRASGRLLRVRPRDKPSSVREPGTAIPSRAGLPARGSPSDGARPVERPWVVGRAAREPVHNVVSPNSDSDESETQ